MKIISSDIGGNHLGNGNIQRLSSYLDSLGLASLALRMNKGNVTAKMHALQHNNIMIQVQFYVY